MHDSTAGYGYFYHSGSPDLGYQQLDAYLCEQPTHRHFDPVNMRVPASNSGSVEYIHVRHPWCGEQILYLAVGRIILTDRNNKAVEAFSFGGKLSIETSEHRTRCILTSDAPIIALAEPSIGQLNTNIESRLVERAEGLIARARAASGLVEEQIISLPPHELYCAIIAALETNLEVYPHLNDEMTGFLRRLHEVHNRLADCHCWVEAPLLGEVGGRIGA